MNIWDGSLFQSIEVISTKYFLINIGHWNGVRELLIFVNVYGPQSSTDKATLWKALLEIKNTRPGVWILIGDFNAVRRKEERFNSTFYAKTASDFNNFIHEMGLIDMKMGGHRFTCFRNSDLKLSKLDRFLVCPTFLNILPHAAVTALPREISDHCPILLSTSYKDYGPTPFRFFNSWMCRDGFEQAFISSWNNFVGYGTPDMYLAAKLRHIKKGLKNWRAKEHPREEGELLRLKKRVHQLDIDAESRQLTEQEIMERTSGYKSIIELEKIRSMDLRQKSRIKWAIDGDENTSFFHGIINKNNRKNRIDGLMINGEWCTDPKIIKQGVCSFFAEKFKEKWPCRPKLVNRHFRKIFVGDSEALEAPISLIEIKKAVWACGNEKAPGPDGFTFKFIKKY